MKEPEIIELAAQMRTAQKKYFSNRTPANLETSKSLERQFDKAFMEYKNPGLF